MIVHLAVHLSLAGGGAASFNFEPQSRSKSLGRARQIYLRFLRGFSSSIWVWPFSCGGGGSTPSTPGYSPKCNFHPHWNAIHDSTWMKPLRFQKKIWSVSIEEVDLIYKLQKDKTFGETECGRYTHGVVNCHSWHTWPIWLMYPQMETAKSRRRGNYPRRSTHSTRDKYYQRKKAD